MEQPPALVPWEQINDVQQLFKRVPMLEQFKKDNDLFHSDYQIENYILIQNGHTNYGMYKQALRELFSREQSLRSLYAKKMEIDIAFEEIQLDIKELDIKMLDPAKESELPRNNITMKRLRIKEAEIVYGMKDIIKVISETEREFKKFYSCAKYLKDKLGDLSDEKKALLEKEFWKETIKDSIAYDIKTSNTISNQSIKRIEESSSDVRAELYNLVSSLQAKDPKILNSFLSNYPSKLEFPKDMEISLPFEVKKLVDNG